MSGERSTTFGARLRSLREDAGLSQEELASRAGLTAKGIGALERGERKRPYPHTVRSLADALGLAGDEREAFVARVPKRTGMAFTTTVESVELSATLPMPPTPLIGRENDVAAVRSLPENRPFSEDCRSSLGASSFLRQRRWAGVRLSRVSVRCWRIAWFGRMAARRMTRKLASRCSRRFGRTGSSGWWRLGRRKRCAGCTASTTWRSRSGRRLSLKGVSRRVGWSASNASTTTSGRRWVGCWSTASRNLQRGWPPQPGCSGQCAATRERGSCGLSGRWPPVSSRAAPGRRRSARSRCCCWPRAR